MGGLHSRARKGQAVGRHTFCAKKGNKVAPFSSFGPRSRALEVEAGLTGVAAQKVDRSRSNRRRERERRREVEGGGERKKKKKMKTKKRKEKKWFGFTRV